MSKDISEMSLGELFREFVNEIQNRFKKIEEKIKLLEIRVSRLEEFEKIKELEQKLRKRKEAVKE